MRGLREAGPVRHDLIPVPTTGGQDMTQTEITVLTGDIVASSKLGAEALDAALGVLRAGCEAVAGWSGAAARFTRFRGDGWQSIGPEPGLALRATLFLRARLRATDLGCDTRISVAIGEGELPTEGDLSAAGGRAFEISGRNLDGMARGRRLAFGREAPWPCAPAEAAIWALCDEISGRWTKRQAAVFARALVPGAGAQATLAGELGVSQQMIAKHLKAGGDRALQAGVAAFEGSHG